MINYLKCFIYFLSLISFIWLVFAHICFKESLEKSGSWVSLFYQLALAVVGSFIFWFVLVHLKERHDQKNINEYVIPRTQNVIGDGYVVFNELAKKGQVPNNQFPPTTEELTQILLNINPTINDAPMVDLSLQHIKWIPYLGQRRIRSQNFIKKIFDLMPYLDTDLVRLLVKVDENGYFMQLANLENIPFTNKDLSFLAEDMRKYFDDIQTLQNFINTNYGTDVSYDSIFNIKRN